MDPPNCTRAAFGSRAICQPKFTVGGRALCEACATFSAPEGLAEPVAAAPLAPFACEIRELAETGLCEDVFRATDATGPPDAALGEALLRAAVSRQRAGDAAALGATLSRCAETRRAHEDAKLIADVRDQLLPLARLRVEARADLDEIVAPPPKAVRSIHETVVPSVGRDRRAVGRSPARFGRRRRKPFDPRDVSRPNGSSPPRLQRYEGCRRPAARRYDRRENAGPGRRARRGARARKKGRGLRGRARGRARALGARRRRRAGGRDRRAPRGVGDLVQGPAFLHVGQEAGVFQVRRAARTHETERPDDGVHAL